MAYIPFGMDKHGREIEEELAALYTAIEYVLDKSMSLREAADWVSGRTGRNISHAGFSKRMKKEIGKIEDAISEEQDTAGERREAS